MQLHLSKPTEWHLHFHIAKAKRWATQKTPIKADSSAVEQSSYKKTTALGSF